MQRRRLALSFFFLLLCSGGNPSRAEVGPGTEVPPTNRAEWAFRMCDPWRFSTDIATFALKFPDQSFAVYRDTWKKFTNDEKKKMIELLAVSTNLRLLDVLDTALRDNGPGVADKAGSMLADYSFCNYAHDLPAYQQWRERIKGLSVENAVRASGKVAAEQIAGADKAHIGGLLESLEHVDLTSANPLAAVRRQTLEAAFLPESLSLWISPAYIRSLPINETPWTPIRALNILYGLPIDEGFARRGILPLLERTLPLEVRIGAVRVLGKVKSPWSMQALLHTLEEQYPEPTWKQCVLALAALGDVHAIPSLISVMDLDDTYEAASVMNEALNALTGAGGASDWDAHRWHRWWLENKTKFPVDVQALLFPKLALKVSADQNGFLIRRKKEWNEIAGDSQRVYYLISPGFFSGLGVSRAQLTGARLASKENTLGLLIVLGTGERNGERLSDYWMEAAQKGLHGQFLVALPVAPKWQSDQPITWATEKRRSQVDLARFTTEEFAAEIVHDVRARYPINPNRVFLEGVGDGGAAAYACSLVKDTPFKGFYIQSAAFKSSELPSLAPAHGRRYVIENGRSDKLNPFWRAQAAQKMLQHQGANVKLTEQAVAFPPEPTVSANDSLEKAISWLQANH